MERAVTGEVAESDGRSLMGWVSMPPGLISYWIQRERAEDSDSGERGRNYPSRVQLRPSDDPRRAA